MKKLYLLIIFFLLSVVVDFGLAKTNLPINKHAYLMGFENFWRKALDTKGENRIILLGGSSLSWGVSAKNLTKNVGVLTLNSGIHASVGFMHFIKNVEDAVDKNMDLIVISPEYSIIDGDSFFSRTKEFCEIALYVRRSFPLECIGYTSAKLLGILSTIDRFSGEYRRDGFNDFGDYINRKQGKNMIGKTVDDVCDGWTIKDLESRYVPFMKKLERRGFRLLYVPTFVPANACKSPEKVKKFHKILKENFGVKQKENVQLLFDDKYFYDTSYHLTHDGVNLKTKIFEDHIKSYQLGR